MKKAENSWILWNWKVKIFENIYLTFLYKCFIWSLILKIFSFLMCIQYSVFFYFTFITSKSPEVHLIFKFIQTVFITSFGERWTITCIFLNPNIPLSECFMFINFYCLCCHFGPMIIAMHVVLKTLTVIACHGWLIIGKQFIFYSEINDMDFFQFDENHLSIYCIIMPCTSVPCYCIIQSNKWRWYDKSK